MTKNKGVHWYGEVSKWEVTFWFNGRHRHLGHYDDHKGAAAVYSRQAREYGTS
jgi:hypothetical protein